MDHAVQTVGQPADEPVDADGPAGGPDLLVVRVGSGEGDVVAEGPAEQERLLGDDPERPRYIMTVRGVGYRAAPAPTTR